MSVKKNETASPGGCRGSLLTLGVGLLPRSPLLVTDPWFAPDSYYINDEWVCVSHTNQVIT